MKRQVKFNSQAIKSTNSSKVISKCPIRKSATVKTQSEQEMDQTYLLKAHGFKPNIWRIISATSNYWGRDKNGYCKFQTKIKVAPKESDSVNIINAINSKIEPTVLPKSKKLVYGSGHTLILPLHDLLFGINTYQEMTRYLPKIFNIMSNGYKHIVIIISGNLFYPNFVKRQTASNARLNHVDNKQLFVDAMAFLRDVIRRSYDFTNDLQIYSIPDSQDSGKTYMFMQAVKEHYRNTDVGFTITTKPYLAFKFGNVGIMICRRDSVKVTNAGVLFASEFQDIWDSTKKHVIFSDHYYSQRTVDDLECLEFELGTTKKMDSYEQKKDWIGQRKLNLYDFSQDVLTAIYYVHHKIVNR